MTKTFRTFKPVATAIRLSLVHPAASFEKGHLRWQVISLDHFDGLMTSSEADVLSAAIQSSTTKPERVHSSKSFLMIILTSSSQGRGCEQPRIADL